MAATLALVRREDDSASDVDSVSLLGYTDGVELATNGWRPRVAGLEEEEVEETLALRIRGSSHNNLATKVQALDGKLKQIADYFGGVEQYGVWLRAQLSGEGKARQAFLFGARREVLTAAFGPELNNHYQINEYTLVLKRRPWWEPIDPDAYTVVTPLNGIGGSGSYVSGLAGTSETTIVGDLPARIYKLELGADSGNGPFYKFWIGFRSSRLGTPANFAPVWSLRLGTSVSADTTVGTTNASSNDPDASDGAKDGYKAVCTFATTTALAARVKVRVQDVAATYPNDQRGTFLVLLRAKTTSTAVCRARLADAFYSAATFKARARVVISSTYWNYYEMGVVTIPSPERDYSLSADPGYAYLKTYTLRVDAERVSGSGNLDMDCLVLIPQEGFVYVDGGNVSVLGGNLIAGEEPNGAFYCVQTDLINPYRGGTVKIVNGLPTGSGIAVLAGQRETRSFKTDACFMLVYFYNRWMTLRGNAG
jgi:hypothetical protein